MITFDQRPQVTAETLQLPTDIPMLPAAMVTRFPEAAAFNTAFQEWWTTNRRLLIEAQETTQSAIGQQNVQGSNVIALDAVESIGTSSTLPGLVNSDLNCQEDSGFAAVELEPGVWDVVGWITVRSSMSAGVVMWPVFYDGNAEYGAGAIFQQTDLTLRNSLGCGAVIRVIDSAKKINFKIKQGGGGVQIDAGTSVGPNSYIRALRIA